MGRGADLWSEGGRTVSKRGVSGRGGRRTRSGLWGVADVGVGEGETVGEVRGGSVRGGGVGIAMWEWAWKRGNVGARGGVRHLCGAIVSVRVGLGGRGGGVRGWGFERGGAQDRSRG